jgi:two-component system sensor histidine kinase PhoQ
VSLRLRLLVGAGIVLLAFLSVTGIVLDRAFRASVEDNAREQLRVRVVSLLGSAELVRGVLALPDRLPEARYNQAGSGLYARILDAAGGTVWSSRSLAAAAPSLPPGTALAPGVSAFEALLPEGAPPLYRYAFGVLWEGPSGDARYTIEVVIDQAPFRAEALGFRRALYTWLGSAGLGLLALQLLVLAMALAPLRRVAAEVERVERGDATHLDGDWPLELSGLSRNLNLLIDSERARQARYRTTLDDLAHSLKTPLAILRNAVADATPSALGDARGQLDRMEEIVGHHLQRASVVRNPLAATAIELEAPVRRIVAGLERLFSDRGLVIDASVAPGIAVAVDERDLYEIVGNLVENACKYGRTQVRISAAVESDAVALRVEDDGPGVPEALRHFVLARGARADTAQAGQGIGLALVTELVAGYGGALELGTSPLGGAAVRVLLPAAQPSSSVRTEKDSSAPVDEKVQTMRMGRQQTAQSSK